MRTIAYAAMLSILPLSFAMAQGLSKQDQMFFKKAAIGGMTEVTEGQNALNAASSPDVKMFAQKMVDDHTANNKELMALAETKGVTLPTAPNKMAETQIDKESKATGDSFDKMYVKDQIRNHEMMQKAMQTEIDDGTDADVKAFAQKTIATVEDHLNMAKSLKASGS